MKKIFTLLTLALSLNSFAATNSALITSAPAKGNFDFSKLEGSYRTTSAFFSKDLDGKNKVSLDVSTNLNFLQITLNASRILNGSYGVIVDAGNSGTDELKMINVGPISIEEMRKRPTGDPMGSIVGGLFGSDYNGSFESYTTQNGIYSREDLKVTSSHNVENDQTFMNLQVETDGSVDYEELTIKNLQDIRHFWVHAVKQ